MVRASSPTPPAAPRDPATSVKRFHYDNHDQLRRHLQDFIDAQNFARRLKILKGLTPYEFICKRWTSEPDRFIINPIHQMPGRNTRASFMKITMHQREIALLETFLSKSTSYFEFGMGGSTCLAAQLVRDRVSAIDSSREWIGQVREAIGEHSGKRIDLRHVDIGPLGGWGTPLSRTRQEHLFPAYSRSIETNGHFDLCLVDGRFRVASFMRALLIAESDTVLAIHDYRVRPIYHLVEEFARPISECQQLTLFVRRAGMDRQKALRCAEKYGRDPA